MPLTSLTTAHLLRTVLLPVPARFCLSPPCRSRPLLCTLPEGRVVASVSTRYQGRPMAHIPLKSTANVYNGVYNRRVFMAKAINKSRGCHE